jgi:thioredoxin reductase (NADPH)
MAEAAGRIERPSILVVDDDADVLRAVEGDVRRRYARDYRVVPAPSGEAGLEVLRRLRRRGDPVALIVSDQRMPGMAGTAFMAAARETYPDARRVLLTAYADTDAAIDAINRAGVDHYILKPWDPPTDTLYPVLDDLLEEWQATTRRPAAGLRVIGDRWSSAAHRMRDFLSRNQVPFRWLDAEHSVEAAQLLGSLERPRLPVVIFEDGTVLQDPEPAAVGAAIGMPGRVEAPYVDLVVVGAGPAGLAAAVYGASEGLTTAVVEAEAPGGQAGTSSRIENYLGFPNGVAGAELARRALAQARRFGASIVSPRAVVRLQRADPYRVVELDDGSAVRSRAVIVATGVQYRTLEADGAEALHGRGVYYGAAGSEAEGVRDEHVVVVGGANSAGQAAVHLARFAQRVTMVVRAADLRLRMSAYLVEQVRALPNVDVRLESHVVAVEGDERLDHVRLRGPGGEERLTASAVFVFIGAHPRTEWLDGVVARDRQGFLETGAALVAAGRWSLDRDPYLLETSVPAVFAVGDVRARSVKRVASAVGEGSVAVQFVHACLAGL